MPPAEPHNPTPEAVPLPPADYLLFPALGTFGLIRQLGRAKGA